MALAEIITIGDELLIGQVIDTNSAWIAKNLNEIGIRVKQISSVSDDETHILNALKEATSRADVVIITGGLGPTRDDITKKTLCKFFGTGMRFDEESFAVIETIFHSRNKKVTPVNRLQAEVPENCIVLNNRLGTAPGMWFEENEKIYVSLPGVPSEMMGLMESEVLLRLKEKFRLTPVLHKTLLTQGVGESSLAEMISDWEDLLPENMKLAYLPGAGMVRLRLTATGRDEAKLRKQLSEQSQMLESIIQEYVCGYDDDKLEAVVGKLLRDNKLTVATAESCTGGYIAHKITSIPGASEYYIGSVVAYSNEIKINELDVSMQSIEQHGAVSEEVVISMAKSALIKFKSDYVVACSGIAGPTGGTKEKPVGTVWIAVGNAEKIFTKRLQLGNHRSRVIHETANHCLNLLRKMVLDVSLDFTRSNGRNF